MLNKITIENKLNKGREQMALLKLQKDSVDFVKNYNTINIDIKDNIERFEIFICCDKNVQIAIVNILNIQGIEGVREIHDEYGVSVIIDKDTKLKEVINTYEKICNVFSNVLFFVELETEGRVLMKDYLSNLLKHID